MLFFIHAVLFGAEIQMPILISLNWLPLRADRKSGSGFILGAIEQIVKALLETISFVGVSPDMDCLLSAPWGPVMHILLYANEVNIVCTGQLKYARTMCLQIYNQDIVINGAYGL